MPGVGQIPNVLTLKKGANNSLEHANGNNVIISYGKTLCQIFRHSDIIGRIGGDEFVVFMKDYGDINLLLTKAQEVCDTLRQKQYLEDDPEKVINTSASLGIAIWGEAGKTFDELYKNADTALYLSKNNSKDCFSFY